MYVLMRIFSTSLHNNEVTGMGLKSRTSTTGWHFATGHILAFVQLSGMKPWETEVLINLHKIGLISHAISCHFWDCIAVLVFNLTHVSSTIEVSKLYLYFQTEIIKGVWGRKWGTQHPKLFSWGYHPSQAKILYISSPQIHSSYELSVHVNMEISWKCCNICPHMEWRKWQILEFLTKSAFLTYTKMAFWRQNALEPRYGDVGQKLLGLQDN